MNFSDLLKRKRQTIISIFVIFFVIGTAFVLLQDFKFGAKSRILVIQEGYGRVDPFAVSRSVEYLSDLFSRVVYSNSFYNFVINSEFEIDQQYFGDDAIKQMKKWKKTVSARAVENSGIININVYHPDAIQAKQIALAVNHVLVTKNQNYQGLGESVKINILDQPVLSKYPVKPGLAYNFAFVFGLGLLFSLFYIYVFPEERYDLNFFSRKSKQVKPMTSAPDTRQREVITQSRQEVRRESEEEEGSIDNLF